MTAAPKMRPCPSCGRLCALRCQKCDPRILGAWKGVEVDLAPNYSPRNGANDSFRTRADVDTRRNWKWDTRTAPEKAATPAPEANAVGSPPAARARGQMTVSERAAFVSELTELVRRTGMSRGLVAHQIGVHVATLGAWLVGTNAPRPEQAAEALEKLAGLVQTVEQVKGPSFRDELATALRDAGITPGQAARVVGRMAK